MSAITAKASRKMKKYAVLTREPRCFLGSFDFSWEQRKVSELFRVTRGYVLAATQTETTKTDEKPYPVYSSQTKDKGLMGYYKDYLYEDAITWTTDGANAGTVNYRAGKFYCTNVCGVLLSNEVKANQMIAEALNSVAKGYVSYVGNPKLMNNVMADIVIQIPTQAEEREQLSSFFAKLDNLITLHQRKCALLFSPFQAFISMMFTTSTFSWEQRKFEEIAVRSSVICSDDTLPRVEYEDIVSGTGRLNKDIYAKQSIKSGIAFHQGDVLYGKLRPYLQNWLLPTFDGLAVGDFWVLQPQNADSSFLYRLIQSRQFDEVANQSTGTKMPRADWKLVSKTVFSIPSNISEQAAIGTYFTALDSLITLHQRKCIFFTGRAGRLISTVNKKRITSSWEQRKAIDIADYSKGNGYSKGDLTDAGTPIILYGRLYTKYQFAISEVDTFAFPRNGAVYSQGNEVIVPASGETAEDIARASAVEKSGVLLGGDLNILRPFDFINPLFLALAISNGEPQKELAKKAQGKSVVHIHNTDIQEVTIAYPSRTEQDRIVSVFRQLDNLITLHQRKPFLMKWRTSDANRNQTNRLVL